MPNGSNGHLRAVRIPASLRDEVKQAARSNGQTIQYFVKIALEAELRRRASLEPSDLATSQQCVNLAHCRPV